MPEGYAIQWETIGPKIQSNPHGLHKIECRVFSAYDIENKKYLEYNQLESLCGNLMMPMCRIIELGEPFECEAVDKLGEGHYENGNPREGVVVRSMNNVLGHKPISFKVINLGYEK